MPARRAARGLRLPLLAVVLLLGIGAPAGMAAEQGTTRARILDQLLANLKTAADARQAAALEHDIRTLWAAEATPAVRLLVARAERELLRGEAAAAAADFDAALALQPELADLWRQRADARFAAGDDRGALADLGAALQREPRDFAALQDLAQMAAARGHWKAALAAWQSLLAIDPHTPEAEDRLQYLRRRAFGEPA